MTGTLILANARLAVDGEIRLGQIVLRDGLIAEIGSGSGVPRGAMDCDGDIVAPGLIELHTDNLERHMQPRPGVAWPNDAAVLAHDGEMASVGVTTVFDALRVGSIVSDTLSATQVYAQAMGHEIRALRAAGALRISHFLHLRAEICSETLVEELTGFGAADRIGIVSLMDHTPGQRQFRDMSKLRAYFASQHGPSEQAFAAHIERLTATQARFGTANEAAAVAASRRCGAVLASHDDTTSEQVAVSIGHGVRLAEFPTTIEAAEASHAAGIAVLMGAPNLMRGGSHSGNVAAETLAGRGLLDILSSDYVPSSLLAGAIRLGGLWGNLARGLEAVTATPARAVGLTDRGSLTPGLRGDLVRLRLCGERPVLRGVWVNGLQVG